MIKSIAEIKLKDIDKVEKTGKVSHLRQWFNLLPSFIFKKRLQSLIDECYEFIDTNQMNTDEYKLLHQARSYVKIQELEICLYIVYKALELDVSFEAWKKNVHISRKYRRKIKESKSDALRNAIESIKKHTGIDFENNPSQAIIELRDKIIFLKDKYDENFKSEPVKQGEKIGILDYAASYALYTGEQFKGLSNMKLVEFAVMKKHAELKLKSENESLENAKQWQK